ncbi:hypothetical protein EK21DRAFT_113164 [Setomelanomma holmii]|uniref:Uncharacterized protein n=1 Tax=Setomelanomma holmii TaxID=210430 RepID=A0A9P4H7J1_9PLEO|nr:hypothetical protein EK21DRAFT_113164 [Setomelanomma holmii]
MLYGIGKAVELKSYTKDELLAILEESCPGALAKFPASEDFEMKMSKRDSKDNPTLRVGNTVTSKNREVKSELWLEEFDSEHGNHHTPRQHPGIQIGNAGRCAGYDPIYRPSYGAEARDDYKLHVINRGLL